MSFFQLCSKQPDFPQCCSPDCTLLFVLLLMARMSENSVHGQLVTEVLPITACILVCLEVTKEFSSLNWPEISYTTLLLCGVHKR